MGFVGISPSSYFWDNGPGPFSRLHLAEPGAYGYESIGYRPWMRNGVTFTGNSDQMYIGQKYTYDNPEEPESGELNNYTDAIVQWSDNPGTWLSDRMRFIFTSEYSSSNPTGSNSMEGLEAMQLYPHDSGSEVFVGIGDWFGQSATPDERLDVLDRTIMIRRLVPDYEDGQLDRLVVTDADGRLHWRAVSSLPVAADNCEWTMSSTSPNHVITAVGAANGARPDDAENVGIGDSSPEAKLDVLRNYTSSNDLGLQVYTNGDNNGTENIGLKCGVQTASGQTSGNEHYGVHSRAFDGAGKNYGVYGRGWLNTGKTTTDNMGVHGDTENGSGQATNAYGVKGYSSGLPTTQGFGVHGYVHTTPTDSSSAVLLAGVYGSVQHANYPNRWAAYFVGAGLHTAGVWQTSDAMLKQNVTDLLNASDILAQLQPKRYQFRTGDYPQLGLPKGFHDGIMAGDLQAVLPNLVRTVNHPAVLDTLGNVIHPAVSFKAVNSDGLIPILVGASNEHTTELNTLQDQVSQLQQQIATLQQDLATCCSAHGSADGRGMSTGAGAGAGAGEALRTDLFIVPNPVADHTQ
ncbi:MAG TPA: tail fiber domain-containing protein, partial [Flavobacteriales bacterium]|nr:tail fiber domain-containing protein [Flavobacteriales bacterium]